MIRRLSLGLLLLPVLAAANTTARNHLPTPEDIAALAAVDDPQIAPDGRRIAYTVGTPQPGGAAPRTQVWRVAFDGDTAPRALPVPDAAQDRQPRWSRDGRQLLFLSDRRRPGADATGPTQVWRVDADGDAATPLTDTPADVTAFDLSFDGAQLAWLQTDPPSPIEAARLAAKDDAVVVERPTRFSRVWLRALPDGAARALTPVGLQVHDLAWSPDGRTLALRTSSGTTLNDYWYDSAVVLLDVASGRIGAPLEPHASAHPLQWSPDGRRLLYGRLGTHGMVATPIVHDIDRRTRIALGAHWPGTLWLARWQDDATLLGQGQRGMRGAFVQLDAATGAAIERARPQIPFRSFTVATDGRAAYLGLRDDSPGNVWTFDGARLTQRSDHHPQVAGWRLGRVRELEWPASRDGRVISALLVTPSDWDGTTRLPTLVQIHGGPAWAWWSGWQGSWHEWAQLLAARGYAVLLPNPRGSEGHGNAFAELARGDWGDGPLQDVLDGLDLLERDGIADPARVAIGGWSYGGYLSAWAVARSDRFRTAIVGAGVLDLASAALTNDVPDYLPGYFGDPLHERARYDAQSPVHHARAVRVPVLILHGEADARVPLSQAQMFHRALRFNGTPVELVTYPRGPHWFHEKAHEIDLQQRVVDWLDRTLR
ncbi:S9 family peptidase [Luteimonas sp. S4-F44]|uniref:alpha/beta hydrolase family protein n=1 Tax=Luteimonas sp. S4-F44 TaxID=2925842 RepID=UPI001F538C32|nr:S9 family peptidase [Luteimonas sp. S4-F44]UNK42621.1 S9 family peptidase [Luteimonas sp. S4-F44]